jgi:hypothetical protein
MRKILFFTVIALLALAFSASAADLNASKISSFYYIEYGKVLVDTTILFNESTSGILEIALPYDARAITMHIDGVKVNPGLDGALLSHNLSGSKRVRYQYISEAFIERDSFLANIKVPLDADQLIISVALPENSVLASPIDSSVPSVLPKPTRLETDGRMLDIIWRAEPVSKGQELPLIVRYAFPGRSTLIWVLLIVLAVLAVPLLYLVLRKGRKTPPKVIVIKNAKQETEGRNFKIDHHLKEDEEQIVNILRDRDSTCEQGTLRVITGFSKAKLSGLLKELEDRKVVHKEKRGKKNLVFLKE